MEARAMEAHVGTQKVITRHEPETLRGVPVGTIPNALMAHSASATPA